MSEKEIKEKLIAFIKKASKFDGAGAPEKSDEGVVGVDSGMLWIGDPCYILDEGSHEDWQKFLEENIFNVKGQGGLQQFNYGLGHPGIGVMIDGFGGDGEYKVNTIEEDGLVKAVVVEFERIMEGATEEELRELEEKERMVEENIHRLHELEE